MEHGEANGALIDQVAPAALYLYRHALELALKALVIKAGSELKKGHDLLGLWNDVSHCFYEREKEDLRRWIAEWTTIDPKSTGFRYPDGIPQARVVGIRRIVENMELLLGTIYGKYDCIDRRSAPGD